MIRTSASIRQAILFFIENLLLYIEL